MSPTLKASVTDLEDSIIIARYPFRHITPTALALPEVLRLKRRPVVLVLCWSMDVARFLQTCFAGTARITQKLARNHSTGDSTTAVLFVIQMPYWSVLVEHMPQEGASKLFRSGVRPHGCEKFHVILNSYTKRNETLHHGPRGTGRNESVAPKPHWQQDPNDRGYSCSFQVYLSFLQPTPLF